jgi:hypothetical protein
MRAPMLHRSSVLVGYGMAFIIMTSCSASSSQSGTGTGGEPGQAPCAFQPDGAVLRSCNKNLVSGSDCETDILSDVNNCGDCGRACPEPPAATDDTGDRVATAWCNNGTCAIACIPNHADCNQMASDGCEATLLTDAANCGACGQMCAGGLNGAAWCNEGFCDIMCNDGFIDCDQDLDDGCEVAASSDPQNCGLCGHVCSTQGGTPSCVDGVCQISCDGSRADCNVDISDGCEVDLTSDSANCGRCGISCGAGTCTNGLCQ